MLPDQIKTAIEQLSKLPGIGPKSAERLVFYLFQRDDSHVKDLANALSNLKEGIVYCERCCNLSESTLCGVCESPGRDQNTVCIVENPMDVFVLESTGAYKGLYHVLHGAISPLDGIGPEQLTVHQLNQRFEKEEIEEIVLATNPTVTGEATAVYISRQLNPRSIRITHLAQGLPMGGQLEFADPDTLKRAIQGRREV
ncbi:MAG: recombination mediator RecR [Candidatus Gracilibacteria bacterium]|nr:recombination mediator RecR [Candidatus Gracilibacteria bacterium]